MIHLLLGSPSLDDSSCVVSHLVVPESRDSVGSLFLSSDGSGSFVEDEPLLFIPW